MGDAAMDVEAHGGALQTAKDLFAGAAGGVAQVLIGKFDLI
jgi:solute carrier family 25 (mitochondrial carnitine/acylcarnitine transporter), member 20/29